MSEWVTLSRCGAADLVHVVGEVDMANAPVIEAELGELLGSAHALVVDLTAVSFIDSAGLRLLDTVVARLEERDAAVAFVVADAGPVRMTMRICSFRPELLHADLPAAQAAVGT